MKKETGSGHRITQVIEGIFGVQTRSPDYSTRSEQVQQANHLQGVLCLWEESVGWLWSAGSGTKRVKAGDGLVLALRGYVKKETGSGHRITQVIEDAFSVQTGSPDYSTCSEQVQQADCLQGSLCL
ncbi:MAG: hypothetical protein JXA25_18940 [Anaerolineales bacterium]|nr:hypothetical protein [Anaerolineales bacterium]